MLKIGVLGGFIAWLSLCIGLFAQTSTSLGNTPEPASPSQNKALYSADLIRDDIRKERYSGAIAHLQDLLAELKRVRQQHLSTYFPKVFGECRVASSPQMPGYFSSLGDDFGVIWSRQYIGKNDRKVDINLVYEDPSIKEYLTTVSNPAIVNALPNTKLLLLEGGFKALQKYSEEDQFYEVNIILSKEILINVLATGVTTPQDLKALLNTIDFQGIKQFLEK